MSKTVDTHKVNEDTELKEAIARETVHLLFSAIPGSVSATIVISTFLAAVLWTIFADIALVVWLVTVTSINLSRMALYKYYIKRDKSIDNTTFWDNSFYLLLVLNGLCFSAVGIFFLPDIIVASHYFPILVLVGLATGAVATLSFSIRNITTYIILIVVPLIIHEIHHGTFLSYSVAVLMILSLIFSLVNAKKIYQTSIENITLHYHSEKHKNELIESRNAAIAANSAKTNFISMISHELRTPLNGMLGFSQLLAMSEAPPLNEEQQEYNKEIASSGKHLLSLIEELLDLAEIESHKMSVTMDAISLADNLKESIAILNPVAAGFNIKLNSNIENKYLVKADSKRLKQVFINLVSNAIKYNSRDGKVTIDAKNIDDNTVRISITDTGLGLTEEQVKGLFQPFQRYDTKKEGLGLGLYITQHIVELMGGRMGVESETEKGSTFWFELTLYHTP